MKVGGRLIPHENNNQSKSQKQMAKMDNTQKWMGKCINEIIMEKMEKWYLEIDKMAMGKW